MRPEDHDEPAGTGPPPDPSVRAWRHPSEIAAAAAAAARCSDPPRREQASRGVLLTVTATVLVATILGAGSFVALAPDTELRAGSTPDASPGSAFDAATALTGQMAILPTGPGNGGRTVSTLETRATSSGPAASTRPATPTTTEPPALTNTALTSTTLTSTALTNTALTNTALTNTVPTTASRAPAASAQWARQPAWSTTQGVWGKGSIDRVASFTLVDGLVLTSASAIAYHNSLEISVGSLTVPARVAATDPATDLALLAVSDQDRGSLIAALAESGKPTVVEADIIGYDQIAVLANGQAVYGSLLTGTTRPPASAGAPVVDDGRLVGMVLDADATLISALPIERVAEVAATLAAWNVGSLAWLGVDGATSGDGGARVAGVAGGGPAELAGIQPTDRIVAIDGVDVRDWSHLVHLTRSAGAGTSIQVEVEREGQPVEITVTVGSRLKGADG